MAAESSLRAAQDRLREEQAACDALKKQMVYYTTTFSAAGLSRAGPLPSPSSSGGGAGRSGGGDGSTGSVGGGTGSGSAAAAGLLLAGAARSERPELRYWEALASVEELLLREADCEGERYALAKVLQTCQVRKGRVVSSALPAALAPAAGCSLAINQNCL